MHKAAVDYRIAAKKRNIRHPGRYFLVHMARCKFVSVKAVIHHGLTLIHS